MTWSTYAGWRLVLAFFVAIVGVHEESAMSFMLLIATSFVVIAADVKAFCNRAGSTIELP